MGIVDLGWAYGVRNDSDTELLVRLSAWSEATTVVSAGVSGPLGSALGLHTDPIVILDSRCFELARFEPSTQIGRLVIDADGVRLEDLIDDPDWTDLLVEPMPYTERCTPPIRWGPLETPGPTLRVIRP
jgi:hypothetical protein